METPGRLLPPHFYDMEKIQRTRDELEVGDQDVFIVTFPKSGTHWMVEIVSLIYSKGDPTWVKSSPMWKRSACVEINYAVEMVKDKAKPRLFTSHLPIHLFPKAYFTSKAKMIYVARNPRDIITSLYHFQRQLPFCQTLFSFEQIIESFLQGNPVLGSWFDHIKGWLPMRDSEKFLFFTYEELIQDLKTSVGKICQFLGQELSEEEIGSVAENASFPVMKKHMLEVMEPIDLGHVEPFTMHIMRTGTCGDWKNHFTVTQLERFNKVYQEKMAGLGPDLFPWDQC
ncbi:3-beta-hydroxysteroid sulfotransferase-like isoform X2 [Monodelphis domestica]|uniref:3-beta-hydroxysteroid sulfotransferase-like isoform X2 n=1 Tax=Monodelphis domestica TaxID=13616 RepID=UPI0024E22C07|nr:3-beta-hydroxysteroid sulfotransferase-like isoform X2 [Monodelphis domestica]